jgi:hypothetical protein
MYSKTYQSKNSLLSLKIVIVWLFLYTVLNLYYSDLREIFHTRITKNLNYISIVYISDQLCRPNFLLGFTPLHHCLSRYGSGLTMGLARLLLEKGADPNAKSRLGAVPLFECVTNNNVEFVKLLLEFGVRIFLCQDYRDLSSPASSDCIWTRNILRNATSSFKKIRY